MKPDFDDYMDAIILSTILIILISTCIRECASTLDIIIKIIGIMFLSFCFSFGLIGIIKRRLKSLSRQLTAKQQPLPAGGEAPTLPKR